MNLRYRWSHPTCREKGWKCDEICFVFTHTLTMQKRSVFVGSTPEDSDERRGETNINWVRGLGRPCPLLALLFVYTYIIYIYMLLIIIFLTFVKEKKEKKNWWRMPWNLLPKEEDCESVSQEEADVHRTIFCFLKFCLLLWLGPTF